MPKDVDTSNQFLVSARGDEVLIAGHPRLRRGIRRAEAINLAAWLALTADPGLAEFQRVVDEIASER